MSDALEQLPGLTRRTRFTTGTLHVQRAGPGCCNVVDGLRPIASTFSPAMPNECEANAQLFATAHKLHAATHRLTFLLSGVPLLIQDTYARKQIQQVVEHALAVLAEAERLTP